MEKRVVVIIDPKNPSSAQTVALGEMSIRVALTLERLSREPSDRSSSDLKKDILEFMVSCLRPEVIEMASNMESKLRLHDADRKDSWKDLDSHEALLCLLREVDELKNAIFTRENPTKVLGEAGDVGNFAMFASSNYAREYKEKPEKINIE
jgi:hypothetical protein